MDKSGCKKRCLARFKSRALGARIASRNGNLFYLERLLKQLGSRQILWYFPLPFESDIRPLLKRRRKGVSYYVPFMEDVSFKMVPYRLPIRKDKFDISQSGNSFFKRFRIDTAIVPAVGVDDDFKRVGFGKGMYDRFFDSLGYRPNIIFIQPELCRCAGVVTFSHDIDGDILITPRRLFFKRTKGNKHANRASIRRGGYRRYHLLRHPKNRPGETRYLR